MDKQAIQDLAESIADDMGYDYFDMTPRMQAKVYDMAMDDFSDMMADKADMMRKNEAAGGMMRSNYAFGSDDKMDQASGIQSLKGTKMASQPDPMAEKNDMSLDLFGKPLELLDEEEMEYLEMQIQDRFGKRDAPSIKMASDDSAMDEYKKYVFEMQEQGIEPVSFKQFLDQILSEARG
tara:strand:+ start:120 stop:656 length:537 start_codon:yes stop_codon:yes gene_type:complete